MREFRFEYAKPPRQGRTVFEVRNIGRVGHSLTLIPLPKGSPPIDEELRDNKARRVDELARIPNRPPGADATFAVDLRPGRYAMVCFVLDDQGQPHTLSGMSSEFRVPE